MMQPFENQYKSNTNFLIFKIMNDKKMQLVKGKYQYLLTTFELDGTYYVACKKFDKHQCIHSKLKEFNNYKKAIRYFNLFAINLIKLS